MQIFAYDFMIKAFIAAVLISIITPLIGSIIVLKRLSAVGDALSHSGLAGVAVGLVFGFNPIAGAVVFSILAALLIELIRRAYPRYAEISTSVVMSLGVGIAAIGSGFVKNPSDFNSFLFGSIVAVKDYEIFAVIVLCAAVLCVTAVLYKELFYVAFDEEGAAIAGVNVGRVNMIFTVLTSVTVAVAARTVGALIISSLMVLPVACSMLVSRSYKSTMVISVLFALFFTVCGLFVSFYANLKPGGTIVIIGIMTLLMLIPAAKFLLKRF